MSDIKKKIDNRNGKFIVVLCGTVFLLQSCFIWKSTIDWYSPYSNDDVKRAQPRLDIYKGPGFILLPLVFIEIGAGEYRVSFELHNKLEFKYIDSVNYVVMNKNQLIYASKIIPKLFYYNKKGNVKSLKKIEASADTIGRVTFTTRLHHVKLDKQLDSLRINFDVFVKDEFGNCQTIRYRNCQLLRDGKRFGSLL